MSEKNRKKKQEQDLVTKRIMAIFVVTVLLLWGMSSLYNMMTFGSTFLQGQIVNNVVMAASGLGAVIMLVLYFTSKKRGTLNTERVVNTGFLALCLLVVCACSFILAMDYYNGMHILYVFLPVVAVLFLVYHVYERQFFTFCVVEAMAISALYCCFVNAWEKSAMLVLSGVLCLIPMGLTLLKGEGVAKITEKVLGKQHDKRYTLLVYAITLALLVAAAMLGGKIALILCLALGAYVLASAVFYTVKAM